MVRSCTSTIVGGGDDEWGQEGMMNGGRGG